MSAMSCVVLLAALLACKQDREGEKSTDEASDKSGSPATPTAASPTAPMPAVAGEGKSADEPAEADEPVADDPIPDIPTGRSKPPTVAEWREAKEVNTQEANSQPEACFMKIVREWLKVNCSGKVTHVDEREGFGVELADYFESIKPGKSADFVVRLRKGATLKTKIHRAEEGNAALFVNWPLDKDKPTIVALGRGR